MPVSSPNLLTHNAQHYDVVIVGAGLVGCSLALSLAQHSALSIAVLERAPAIKGNPNPNQRVVALGNVASSMLQENGVFDALGAEFCHPYQRMFVWDECSAGELNFDAQQQFGKQQINQQKLSEPPALLGHMIDSVQCTWLLQQALLDQRTIHPVYECQLTALSIDDNGAHLSSDTGDFSAPLIVAADGARSWVRQQAKIFANHRAYNQQGIVAKITTENSHEDTAWQRFLATGPVAILPLSNNQSSIVWSADTSLAKQLMKASDTEFEEQLAQALEYKLGKVSLLSKRQAFPLHSQQAERYFSRHIALVGDAAHSIHPLAGQGANLGFKDVQALSTLLAKTAPTALGDLAVLQHYQQQRKADNQQTDLMMSALHRAYQHNSALWSTLRGLGMNAISSSSTVKQLLAKQAMGLK